MTRLGAGCAHLSNCDVVGELEESSASLWSLESRFLTSRSGSPDARTHSSTSTSASDEEAHQDTFPIAGTAFFVQLRHSFSHFPERNVYAERQLHLKRPQSILSDAAQLDHVAQWAIVKRDGNAQQPQGYYLPNEQLRRDLCIAFQGPRLCSDCLLAGACCAPSLHILRPLNIRMYSRFIDNCILLIPLLALRISVRLRTRPSTSTSVREDL